ncbi:hypothetical protein [Mycobacterium avium]|uniref:hypothetical protein n=1 Tax=Mycobacterium avium TaxID=1764 RepID=UPI001070CB16|nr:hypothetical protein [Mycobacterium avium]MDV3265295.1 hypothetical protein [Mycobacterium avium]UEA20804.1 hypothetical protein LK460_04580 [Mycobacterium avium subsp. avium]UEA32890.1 hypothetical protein LK466_14320 [Mycobacterium avium subsp. avium]UGU10778.1 hypothetical protein LTQ57_17620 [Mycobacterium avium subsp. avium]UGU20785.1 hypothetical protein LT348_02525 [Mycobacterium avium subsp. avium]
MVVLIGEHPDAFNVVLYLLGALHIGRVNSRSHRAAQAVERDVGSPHRFPTRRVDNGQPFNLECPFGVEGRFTQRCGGGPKLPYELAARKYVLANVLDHFGLGVRDSSSRSMSSWVAATMSPIAWRCGAR